MRKIHILLVMLLSSVSLYAEPIGENRARQIAEDFFFTHATRAMTYTPITLEWAGNAIDEASVTGSDLDNALLYIYTRGEREGFVVVAGDSNIEPIIAYSFDTTLDTSDMAEATRAILDAWCRQVQSARENARPISGDTRATTRNTDNLLYDTALWNQSEPYNREAPIYDGYRSVTGCVATALAIVCYHNRWPQKGVGTTPEYSYEDSNHVIRTVPENKLGRSYDYDNMLFDYNNGYTEEQGNAVAALMKDLGTAVQMMYYYTESGAFNQNVLPALINHFDYSRGMVFEWRYSYSDDEWHEMMRENLRNYGPTYYSGQSGAGGHAFVIDGYDPNDFFHFNFGWGGAGNGYYRYPNMNFYEWQGAVLNLEPGNDSAPYRDKLLLYYDYEIDPNTGEITRLYQSITTDATKYETGLPFNVIYNTTLNDGVTPYYGDIRLVLCSESGEVKEVLSTQHIDELHVGNINRASQEQVTITSAIELGDRLRVQYKQQYYDEWTWARRYAEDISYDDVVVCATAEEIAKELTIWYYKQEHILLINTMMPLHMCVYDATDALIQEDYIPMQYNYTIDTSAMSGSYVFTFSLGSDPYKITIKF